MSFQTSEWTSRRLARTPRHCQVQFLSQKESFYTFRRKERTSILSMRSSSHRVHLWPPGLSLPLQPQWPPSPPSTQMTVSFQPPQEGHLPPIPRCFLISFPSSTCAVHLCFSMPTLLGSSGSNFSESFSPFLFPTTWEGVHVSGSSFPLRLQLGFT